MKRNDKKERNEDELGIVIRNLTNDAKLSQNQQIRGHKHSNFVKKYTKMIEK